MKHFFLILPLALAGFLLAMAAPDASAKAYKAGMVDPVGGQTIPPVNNWICDGSSAVHSNMPCNITSLGAPPYVVDFLACDHPGAGVIPNAIDLSGYVGGNCLWLSNNTGSALTTFSFTMPVPTGLGGSTISCQASADANIRFTPTGACALGAGLTLEEGGMFTLSFAASPGVPGTNEFFLLTDFSFADNPLGPASVTVGVPEPGVLGLFGLGLLGIGMGYGWQRRRRTFRGNEAA